MRNVFRSTSAFLVLGVALVGCNGANNPDDSSGKPDQTSSATGANEVLIKVSGMT